MNRRDILTILGGTLSCNHPLDVIAARLRWTPFDFTVTWHLKPARP